MYNEKLSQLADFLAHEVKDEGFWLGLWFREYDKAKSCNTVACAFGWAPVCFGRSSGLSIAKDKCGDFDVQFISSTRGKYLGVPAARAFFGISRREANYLFIPDSDPSAGYADNTPRLEVAKRIKQFAIDGRMRRDSA